MDKKELRDILDTVYELEGLLCLATSREDMPENLLGLIAKKSKVLAYKTEHFLTPIPSEGEKPDSIYEGGKETGIYEITESEDEENLKEELSDIFEYEYTDNNESEFSEKKDFPEVYSHSTNEELVEADLYQPEADLIENNINLSKEDLSENETAPRGKLVFSINDKYRFKRELFANSALDFNTTLAVVASMENFEEAEDYFLNELQFDPSKGVVNDFLEIIRRYFSK